MIVIIDNIKDLDQYKVVLREIDKRYVEKKIQESTWKLYRNALFKKYRKQTQLKV